MSLTNDFRIKKNSNYRDNCFNVIPNKNGGALCPIEKRRMTVEQMWNQLYGMDILTANFNQKCDIPESFRVPAAAEAKRFHCQLEGYDKTPLVCLKGLANILGVKDIFVKNEAERFGLNAFKGLGGSYAMFCILCHKLGLDPKTANVSDLKTKSAQAEIEKMVFVTATDGNHGRGVSWAGGIFGCHVHVYMPAGSAEVRAEAIRMVGPAKVTITDMNYDETVQYAMEQSKKNGWYLIQDTSWEDYEKIPTWIVQGYLTMASEITEELTALHIKPTHLFLQAGVGAMAGGVLGYFADYYGEKKPITIIIEPNEANCVYLSAQIADGEPHQVQGDPVTIMAGLNCGTPCKVTWPILRDYADYYMSCPDYVAAYGMRTYAAQLHGDKKIISGESGAATIGALSLIMSNKELQDVRGHMGLNKDSVIVLINTEGDTDPDNYFDIVQKGKYPLP